MRSNGYLANDVSVNQLKRDMLHLKLRSRRPSNDLHADSATKKRDPAANVEDGIVGKKLERQGPN